MYVPECTTHSAGVGVSLDEKCARSLRPSPCHRRLPYTPVEVEILRRRLLPAEVSRHRLAHHVPPAFWILILIDGANRCTHEVGSYVFVEQKAGDVVLDGVGQPTDATRDGDCAVALGAHLRETARLVLRGHQTHVGAGEELVLEVLREAQLHRDATGRARRNGGECGLVARLAGTEEEKLSVEREVAGVSENEIETFLGNESRRHREDRHTGHRAESRRSE